MRSLLLLILSLSWTLLTAQEVDCYEQLVTKGKRYANAPQPDYESAMYHYLAALNCPDRPTAEADELPALIDATLQARVNQLNGALQQVETEKENTQTALDQADQLIDAFYFYEDRFALAFKSNQFYFIDKNGDPVEKLGRWEQAEQFDKKLGLAKVFKQGQEHLLDTFGISYPFAEELDQLTPNITAFDFRKRYWNRIPQEILENDQLEVLLLSDNAFATLPDSFGTLTNLKILHLSGAQLYKLPESFSQLVNLRALYLGGNQLVQLPDKFGQLEQLTVLDLSTNYFSELPESFRYLKNLSVLKFQNNQILGLPEWFGELINLINLDLSRNILLELPESFGHLIQLRSLDLSHTQINKLPESFGQLAKLNSLNLYYAKLKELPESFGHLNSLNYLNLNSNQLTGLPTMFRQLTNLNTLSLGSNQLSELPPFIGQLANLEWFNLSRNQLKSLPGSFGRLSNLKSLDLVSNQLKTLPESFAKLSQLEDLALTNNQLDILPSSVTRLTNLKTLTLNANQLTTLPNSVTRLTNLKTLTLNANQLTTLPDSFGQLTSLIKLDLDDNQLKALPESFGRLASLNHLDLSFNQLSALPNVFEKFKNLTHLDFRGNPIQNDFLEKLRAAMPWCRIYPTPPSVHELFRQGEYHKAFINQLAFVGEYGPNVVADCEFLSRFALFAQQPQAAIEAAQKGLERFPEFQYLNTYLALGYVMNDQWSEAEKIYNEWKGKSFSSNTGLSNDAFLNNIAELEAAGITHPDFAKVRALLAEEAGKKKERE